MKKTDRRVKKTEKALAEALSTLLVNKKIQAITIRELTETANVHRSTFYTHYKDIYDLYDQLESNFFRDLNEILSYDPAHSYEELYTRLIDYVYANTFLYRLFILNHGDISFQKKVKQVIEENYLNIWLYEDKKTIITEEMRFFTTYHVQGCLSVLNRWVESNYKYSKKELLELLQKLNDHIEKIMP
ncbi:TetR/AcrR family transcriptional regulator [Enterococcus faecium]|uniref:TetR/AcrR family transcriptional regulator n=1 Tax=Enterococcus TaxID=1350 RepID=UPI000CF2AD83|nr:TetR/AcrR family transcriptional regulator [Enterococcus faecium]EGP5243516.1 TetR/AcrR family transcriptional regulator [Enterococcus faecium]EME8230926.1 TetR/AcrR family transcriptional regulator [Enterococcus faecium]MBE9892889.1 TetR/AcrR family transcriptional regulator [Enterococcus faecium]MCV3162337.1 TetR/AcrR family transcriptional regulator [Enterococcus faecium]MCV3170004.1 TetR/AcrR family transcriptional regulator [Enterococcus faecium]